MKSSRFKFEFRESASKLHRTVGETLRGMFPTFRIYQEYPVNRINTEYKYSSHHFDWVIFELKLIVECHGEQHDSICNFGNTDSLVGSENLAANRRRDQWKMDAAVSAGWTYIVVPWYDISIVNSDYLWKLIKEAK